MIAYIIIALEAVAIGVLVFLLIRNFKSHKQIMEKAGKIVQGELNVEDIRINGNVESSSGVVASAFNSIKSNLMTFVEATKGNVIVLSDAIDVLSKSVDANQNTNDQIAQNANDAAANATAQLKLVQDNLEIIELNNRQMTEIDRSMAEIKGLLDNTTEISENGVKNLEGYERDITTISEDLECVNSLLTEFNNEIAQIEEVGDFIIDVSEQLMLLAFNASIEAARAGESGKGFAVVADEMNEMSIKTKEGMGTINGIVSQIKESSASINDRIGDCEATFSESKKTFEEVNNSLRTINCHAKDVQTSMSEISGKFGLIARNSNVSKTKAKDLYDASVAITESTQEIAAASQITAAESTQIGENVEALGGMLTGIQGLLKQFSTAVVPVEKASEKPLKIKVMSMLDNDFWYAVRRGILYAQKELQDKNCIVEYFPCDGSILDQQKDEEFKACETDGTDVVVLPGFIAGDHPQLKRLVNEGKVKVMTFNCDCDPSISRMACFSPDSKEAGMMAAKTVEKAYSAGCNVGILLGDQTVQGYKDRYEGFMEQIGKSKGIKVVSTKQIVDSEEDAYEKAMQLLKENVNLDIIYIMTGAPLAVSRAIVDSGRVGKVKEVCFDHSPEIFEYIRQGVILSAIGQDAFGQGHDPIIWAYNHLVAGDIIPSENMPCRSSVVDKSNVETLINA